AAGAAAAAGRHRARRRAGERASRQRAGIVRPPALEIGPALRVEVTTAVVLGVRLLALPCVALERELRAAARRHPPVLAPRRPACARCGRRLAAGRCPGCARPAAFQPEPGELPAVVSGWEQLRHDLLAALPTRLAGAAVTVLAALDERGLIRRQELVVLPAE